MQTRTIEQRVITLISNTFDICESKVLPSAHLASYFWDGKNLETLIRALKNEFRLSIPVGQQFQSVLDVISFIEDSYRQADAF